MRTRFDGKVIGGTVPAPGGERGILLGDGAFETMLALNGTPVWLAAHLDRLEAALSVLGMRSERALLESEARAVTGREPGVLRLSVMRGGSGRALAGAGPEVPPAVLASFSPLPPGVFRAPVRLAVSSVRRNEGSPSSRMKTLSYADNILASREAAARGADEALMLNNAGRVASAGIGNIFVVSGRRLITPPGTEGVLEGITRRKVLGTAPRLGLEAVEAALSVGDLVSADAVFMTNSLRLASPVTELDGKALKCSDAVYRVFAALCAEIASETGLDPRETLPRGQ